MNRLVALIVLLAGGAMSGSLHAQHVHSIPHTTTHYDTVRHGHHYHVVPHTTTHYHNVLHYGPDYPTYSSSPAYSSYPSYSTYPSNLSMGPSNLSIGSVITSSSPVVNSSPMIVNSQPTILSAPTVVSSPAIATVPSSSASITALKPNVIPYTGRGVKIVFPKDLDGEINYLIDGVQQATIRSGEEHLLAKKGTYEVRFSRGENEQGRNFGNARYTITEGLYRFALTDNGWELFREREGAVELSGPKEELGIKKNVLPPTKSAPERISL